MNPPQLLMIEDDARLAQMVREYLTQSGFTVAHAGDGASGLAQLQEHAPDLVILDLMLPDTDGLDVCRRIRALPGAQAKVPVLMLTAKGDPMDRIIGLEIGADDYLPKPFEPRELLASIVDEHAMSAAARGLTLESEASGVSGLVDSDPHRIRQIVNNLVTNAIRYTETGTVRVKLMQRPALLSFIVSDTGPGVPQAQIPLIFEEFTQLDSSRTRRFEGAGMGLAIVQGLVRLFGGSVEVSSMVGEGTTFTVTIPVTPVASAQAPGVTAQAEPGGARPSVLIVDDNRLMRESLGEMVAHMEFDAHAVANADDALAWLDAHRCDVVLLDLHMPERDGYAFLADLAARGGPSSEVPVIVVSAYAPEAGAKHGGETENGALPFFEALLKPIHYGDLRNALQRALASRHTV